MAKRQRDATATPKVKTTKAIAPKATSSKATKVDAPKATPKAATKARATTSKATTPKEQEKAAKKAKKTEKKQLQQENKDEIAQIRLETAEIPPELKVQPSQKDDEDAEVPPARVARKRKLKELTLGANRKFPIGHALATPEPTTISLFHRLAQFPNQGFRKFVGPDGVSLLFCDVCNTPVSMIKQRIQKHLNSVKHARSLAMKLRAEVQSEYDQDVDESKRVYGDTLVKHVTEARMSILYALMQSAVPREKLYTFCELRQILEKGASCTLPRTALEQLIPRIAQREDMKLKSELENVQHAAIIFDGASEVTEVFSIIIRFWDGCIKQRAVSLSWLARNMNATQQATHMISQLGRRIVNPMKLVCATIHDGASVNGACVEELRRHSPNLVDITCVSHTVCLCEKGFHCPTAEVFISDWGTMIASSWRAREKFRELTGQQPLRPARVKWFAKHEVVEQLVLYWPAVVSLVNDDHGYFSPTLREKMRVLLRDKIWMLKQQLALMYDVGRPLIRLCYLQEGDDLLAPLVYDDIFQAMQTMAAVVLNSPELLRLYMPALSTTADRSPEVVQKYLPNLCAVAREYVLHHPNYAYQQVLDDNLPSARGVIEIFSANFLVKYKETMKLWKFCRLFNHNYVKSIEIDALQAEFKVATFPQPLRQHRAELAKEIAVYHQLAQDEDAQDEDEGEEHKELSIQDFWRTKGKSVPTWKTCVEYVSLLQPSSGASERSFSVLRWSFDSQQESTLADYKETSVLIRFNDRAREAERKLLEVDSIDG